MMKKLVAFILILFALHACTMSNKLLMAKTYGDEINSKGRVLVTYATRAGSTIEV